MSAGHKLPPGPRGFDAYGFFGRGSAARAVAFLQKTAREYGPISSFRVLNQRLCLIDDAELIEQVLITRQHEFVRDNGATLLRELVGDGLLTSDEPRHREIRRTMQPAFHRARIATYASAMAREAESAAACWHEGDRIDIGSEMKRLTLKIVGRALFGADFGASTARVAELLRRAIRRSAKIAVMLPLIEPALVAYRRWRPDAPSVFFRGERAELETFAAKLPDPMFGLNEIITLILAGHETTATALTWAWYLIARHPEVEQRLDEELDEVLGGREATFEDVPRLEYTSRVFTEVLRLYPPALAFGRRPIEAIELGGYTLPARTSVIVSPYITQRNPRYFDRPDEFDPDRWLTAKLPRLAYFPFGAGAKMCIGDSFAKLEAALVLAAIARWWRLRLDDNAAVGVRPGITLAPDRPIYMTAVTQSSKPDRRPHPRSSRPAAQLPGPE